MNAPTRVLVESYVYQHKHQRNVENIIPQWTKDLCPEVVKFFEMFPAFLADTIFPTIRTHHAVQLVCGMKLARDLASSIGSPAYLYSGSHLGALRNGGHIFWDDDADLILPHEFYQQFVDACNNNQKPHEEVKLKCIVWSHAVKLSVESKYSTPTSNPWTYPYVDIFFYKTTESQWFEVTPDGSQSKKAIDRNDYFPTREYYYSGLYFEGPRPENAKAFGTNECWITDWNHRLETWSSKMLPSEIDCCHMGIYFPFKYNETHLIRNGTYIGIPLKS